MLLFMFFFKFVDERNLYIQDLWHRTFYRYPCKGIAHSSFYRDPVKEILHTIFYPSQRELAEDTVVSLSRSPKMVFLSHSIDSKT